MRLVLPCKEIISEPVKIVYIRSVRQIVSIRHICILLGEMAKQQFRASSLTEMINLDFSPLHPT